MAHAFQLPRTRRLGRDHNGRLAALKARSGEAPRSRSVPHYGDAEARQIVVDLLAAGECASYAALEAAERTGGDWHTWNRLRVWAGTTLRSQFARAQGEEAMAA